MTNSDPPQSSYTPLHELQGGAGSSENPLAQLVEALAARSSAGKNEPTRFLDRLAEYNGDRDELEPWIAQAQAKLSVDYKNCTETTKFFALHNRLRGKAARQLQAWVTLATQSGEATADNLYYQLRLSFGDPHIKEKAIRKLRQLR